MTDECLALPWSYLFIHCQICFVIFSLLCWWSYWMVDLRFWFAFFWVLWLVVNEHDGWSIWVQNEWGSFPGNWIKYYFYVSEKLLLSFYLELFYDLCLNGRLKCRHLSEDFESSINKLLDFLNFNTVKVLYSSFEIWLSDQKALIIIGPFSFSCESLPFRY